MQKVTKVLMILMVSLLAVGMLAACGNSGDEVQGDVNAENTINSLAEIMGKDDVAVVAALGEGKAGKGADGTTVVEREFEMTLFEEEVLVRVDYADDGKAELGLVFMNSSDVAPYKAQMESIYGKAKEINPNTEENQQSTDKPVYTWQVKKSTVVLGEAYGIIAIEVSPAK